MDDFETVRYTLQYLDSWVEADAALSRIEAEVERLKRNGWDKADREAGYLVAENERLRAERDHNELRGLEYKAENERLRDEVNEKMTVVQSLYDDLADSQRDNEILRSTVQEYRQALEGRSE